MADLKFGKKPRKSDYRTLRFRKYISQLPKAPKSYDVLHKVYSMLGITDPTVKLVFPMDGNDIYGDCVVAGWSHIETIFHGLVGDKRILSADECIKIYMELTGGVDEGLVMLDFMKWYKNQEGQDFYYAQIDRRNHDEVRAAIAYFGGVYLGFQVTESTMLQFESGRPWTPDTLVNAGHAVVCCAYDNMYLNFLTWGAVQQGTWDFWDWAVDEAYVILPKQALNPDFCPGLDYETLKEDIIQLGGVK